MRRIALFARMDARLVVAVLLAAATGCAGSLRETGRKYYLSIDFDAPVPPPESSDITLDLSTALSSPRHPPVPLIRFAPSRWKEGYT